MGVIISIYHNVKCLLFYKTLFKRLLMFASWIRKLEGISVLYHMLCLHALIHISGTMLMILDKLKMKRYILKFNKTKNLSA